MISTIFIIVKIHCHHMMASQSTYFFFLVWCWSSDNFNVLIKTFDFASDQVHVVRLDEWSYLSSSLYNLALSFARQLAVTINWSRTWSFIMSYHSFENRSVICMMACAGLPILRRIFNFENIANSHRIWALTQSEPVKKSLESLWRVAFFALLRRLAEWFREIRVEENPTW